MAQQNILLKDWDNKPLREVLDTLESGGRPKGGAQKEGIPSIGGEHLNNDGKFNFEKMKFIPKDYFSSMSKGIIEKKDVLIVKDGATTGKTSFVNNDFPYEKSAVNEHVFIARANDKIFSKYLFYFLYSLEGQEQLKKAITGSAQGGINLSILDKIYVKYPLSKETQRLIVSAIETQFTRLEESIQSLKSIKKKIDIYRKAILKKAFERKEGWEEKTLKEACEEVFAGGDLPKGNWSKEKTDEYQIPIYANGIQDKGLYGYTNIIRTNKKCVTVSARGTIGHTEIREEPFYPIVRLIVAIPKKELDYKYLKYNLDLIGVKGNGISIPQLTVPKIKLEKIAFPPSLSEQQKRVKEIESKFSIIDKIEVIVNNSLKKSEQLKKSILKSAFEGRLVKEEEL